MKSISRYLMALLAIAFFQQNIHAQSGNVGVNQNSPASSLDVNGNLIIGSTFSGDSIAPVDGAIIQGNVGIGTASPANKLDIEGGVAIGANYSGTSTAPVNGAIIEGRLGIGTNNPVTNLHVNSATGPAVMAYFSSPNNWGEIQVGCIDKQVDLGVNESGIGYMGTKTPADFHLRTNNGAKVVIQDATGNVGIGTDNPLKKLHLSGGGDVELMIESTSATGKKWTLQSNATNPSVKTSFQILDRTAGASRLGIDSLGRVGIGTVTPFSKLAVNGNLAIGSNYSGTIAAPNNGAIIEGNVGLGMTSPIARLHSRTENGIPGIFESGDPVGGFLSLGNTSTNGKWFQFISTGSNLGADVGKLLICSGPQSYQAATIMMVFDPSTSQVGIGTNTPANRLDVEGSIAIGATYSGTSAAPSNGAIIEGNVGIGTVNPSSTLHVNSATGATPIAYFTAPDNWGEIRVGCNNKYVDLGSNESGYGYIGTKSPADLYLRTNDGVKVAIQDSTGNVGIGTTTPVNKLDVEGGLAIGSTYSGISAAPTDGAIIEGNVGIGTNSTSAKLHVKSSSLDIAKMEGSSPYGSWLVIGNTPNSNWFQMIATGDQNGYGTDKLVFGGGTSPYAPSGIIMTLDRTTRNVGIGTTSPQAPLHVTGASGVNSGTDIKYFNHTATNITSASNWQGQTAILANGNICATAAFIAGASFNFSDARIKNIIGRSDGAEDLTRLNQIEITRYTHIDTIAKGNAVQTKVIAQQLETVMPEAVSYTREFIPNVMQVAESLDFSQKENVLTVSLTNPHSLSAGDHIKCIDEKGQELLVIVLATPNENSLTFKTDLQPSQLFIYGKQVDDFHIVDYDAIAMLNVSATQELARKLTASEEKVKILEDRLAKLEAAFFESNLSAKK